MARLHASTGMGLQMLRAPVRTHALSQVVQRHPTLRPGDVLVADRGLCAYAHLALRTPSGVPAVLRMHQQQIVAFTPRRPHAEPGTRSPKGQTGWPRSRWVRQRGQHDHVVDWRKPATCPEGMRPESYAQLPKHLTVRALRYHVHQKGVRVKTVTFVTTLVDAQRSCVEDLATLFLARWGIATHWGHVKTPMGLDVLTCKTVNGVRKERNPMPSRVTGPSFARDMPCVMDDAQ